MTSSKSAYTVRLFMGGLAPKFEDVIYCADDEAAIDKAKALLLGAAKIDHSFGPLSVLVGRGAKDTNWLGAWHWNEGPEWMRV